MAVRDVRSSKKNCRNRRVLARGLCTLAFVALAFWPRHAPANVQEQRSRLPPPVVPNRCADPVSGTWRAHVFYDHVDEWGIITLRISRKERASEVLLGTIEAQWWDDTTGNLSTPPACAEGVRMFSVLENARGSFTNGVVEFNAVDWKWTAPRCGEQPSDYLLDLFRGQIDSTRQEFQSVLNADSPDWQNVPTVFRRIGCDDPPTVTPPPLPSQGSLPARRQSGSCACRSAPGAAS